MEGAAAKESTHIKCEWCGAGVHSVRHHLLQHMCSAVPEAVKDNPEIAFEEYRRLFPNAPTLSALAQEKVNQRQAQMAKEKASMATTATAAEKITPIHGYIGTSEYRTELVAAHEILCLDASKLCSATGGPVMITSFINRPFPEFVPEAKDDYVFSDIELIKDVLMMLEVGIPGYIWGHAGTGKTSLPSQIAALTGRPLIRSQHTASTEEAHITGQILAREGSTYFEPGLLALAMRYGWVYLADEYDFAFPQILSLYQPVLEGEPLIIKEATPEWRRVDRHKHFAFIGTGNTNGSGDETGLYQGTNVQNAANFSRFGIVSWAQYMPPSDEVAMLVKIGIPPDIATNLVDFALKIRAGYEGHEIAQPIGPRELLQAARVGAMRQDFKLGLQKAFINKLPAASMEAANNFAERIFG